VVIFDEYKAFNLEVAFPLGGWRKGGKNGSTTLGFRAVGVCDLSKEVVL
jgi:hypothetical protein